MIGAPAAAHRREQHAQREQREIDVQVGLLVFLGATAMLFAAVLLAYAIVRSEAPLWPPAGAPSFPRGAAGANTLALIATSLALRRAAAARNQARAWVAGALACGATFLALQAILWSHLVAMRLGPAAGALGAVFFALSGLHAAHVLGGLIALAITGTRRLRALTLYWDFVLLVWLVVYVAVCWL